VADALAWTFQLLSQNPRAEAALHSELDGALAGRLPVLDDLPRLPYTRMVFEESLRLYPPLWLINRTALEDDQIGGARIKAGTHLFISPYVTHRHPGYWDTPDEFRPERFSEAEVARRPKLAYLPFSAGPRQCIGNELALLQGKLVLATISQRYRLTAGGRPVEPEAAITLRPKGGLKMIITARHG
jgi:cytochrome P450